jgi:hypothetical protein
MIAITSDEDGDSLESGQTTWTRATEPERCEILQQSHALSWNADNRIGPGLSYPLSLARLDWPRLPYSVRERISAFLRR